MASGSHCRHRKSVYGSGEPPADRTPDLVSPKQTQAEPNSGLERSGTEKLDQQPPPALRLTQPIQKTSRSSEPKQPKKKTNQDNKPQLGSPIQTVQQRSLPAQIKIGDEGCVIAVQIMTRTPPANKVDPSQSTQTQASNELDAPSVDSMTGPWNSLEGHDPKKDSGVNPIPAGGLDKSSEGELQTRAVITIRRCHRLCMVCSTPPTCTRAIRSDVLVKNPIVGWAAQKVESAENSGCAKISATVFEIVVVVVVVMSLQSERWYDEEKGQEEYVIKKVDPKLTVWCLKDVLGFEFELGTNPG
ncbi:hypothetical protein CROQUDRAFT_86799 [Cronartium quercuum f. sp. fusiforme G11]|uniref:Uncharacterized protein n=1 Tax=Cronartium quercuum f. sp. fusiforme G11 TaxID=708437 RepID=A0A9P6NTK0_9BASI|nr:hypothetical protein CROQUDRAFT_86799 [Cronartium quercuum f. sp. fusiforme G11]